MSHNINTDLNLIEIGAIAIGTFSIATCANLVATHVLEDEKEKRKRAIYLSIGGIILSGLLIKFFDVKN